MDNNSVARLSEQDLHIIRREVMENVGIGLFRFRFDGTVLYADQTAMEITGLSARLSNPQEAIGKNIEDLIGDAGKIRKVLSALSQGLRLESHEHSFKTLDGKTKWARHVSYLTHDLSTGIECIQSAIFDITILKIAQSALSESERRVKSLLEAADDAIFSLDGDGKFLFCNFVAAKKLGFETVEDLLGKRVSDLFSTYDMTKILKGIKTVFESGEVDRSDMVPLLVANQQHWFSSTLSPVFDDEGAVESVVGISRDVTDFAKAELARRKLEEQVQQSQKMESLGLLAVGIAHDFNNLLVAVLGNADLALMDLPPDSSARLAIEQIRNAAVKASELTNQMLAYSGRGQALVRKLDINRILQDMIQLIKGTISKRIVLDTDLGAELPLVHGDSAQLQQVLMNLVINAAESIGERKGRISISTSVQTLDENLTERLCIKECLSSGPYVSIQVSDTGIGMDTDTMDRIFEPFFTTKFTGRGLGLSALLGIVRSHKGTIYLDSKPGEGSTFSVLLPALGAQHSIPLAIAETKSLFNTSGIVLVVDDEASVRQVARDMLTHFGFKVIVAANGPEALEILKKRGEETRLILLDLSMPEMSGVDTLRSIYKLQPELPVILCSGYSEEDAIGQFLDVVPAGFIQKPFDVSRLLEKLKEVLD